MNHKIIERTANAEHGKLPAGRQKDQHWTVIHGLAGVGKSAVLLAHIRSGRKSGGDPA